MNNKGKPACVAIASALVLLSSPASAQDRVEQTGMYVAFDVGIASVDDIRLTYSDEGGTFGGTGAQDSLDARAELKRALTFGAAIGYDFGTIRTDLEVDYSRNRVRALRIDSVNGAPVTLTPGDGDDICDYLEADGCSVSGNSIAFNGSKVRQLSAMANLWLDLPLGAIAPYAGGGVGIAGYEFDGEGEGRFAWQLGAGVAFDLSPNVSITADYRRRQVKGTNFTDSEFPDEAFRIGKVRTNSFTAGIRFRF